MPTDDLTTDTSTVDDHRARWFDLFLSQFIFKWPDAYGQPWHDSDELRAAYVAHYAAADTTVLNNLADTVNDWIPVRRGGVGV